jgi:hypothetical protein
MTTTLHVLSIGSTKSCNFVRDVLLVRGKCRLFSAVSYQDLCAVPANERFEIAVIYQTLSEHELRVSLEYVRRHWPSTKILLVSANSESIDDPLYDEWACPEISQNAFLTAIEQLAVESRRKKHQSFEG